MLGHKRLKEDAVHCIWPGSPHLSKITSARPTTFASSESRRENFARLQEEEELDNISQDTFKSLDEFQEKEGHLNIPADVTKIQTIEYVLFLNLNVTDIPKIIYSVQITTDLQFIVYHADEKIKQFHLQNITSRDLNTFTALSELFSLLESKLDALLTDQDIIDNIVENLQLPRFESNSKIGFLIQQLHLLFKAPTGRRYSSSLLAMTALLQRISPACYKQMQSDGFCNLAIS